MTWNVCHEVLAATLESVFVSTELALVTHVQFVSVPSFSKYTPYTHGSVVQYSVIPTLNFVSASV